MKLVDGLFKYNETVAIDVDGALVKRKVHYADGELYVDVNGKRITEKELGGVKKFDQSAYIMGWMKENKDKISVAAPKGTKDKWKAVAKDLGMSMNAFIIYCVEKEIHGKEN